MKTSRTIVALLVSIGLLAARGVASDSAPDLPKNPLDIHKPAICWAAPWDGPPIRGLVITPWAASRDAYVVAQHMPFEFDVVQTRDSDQINFDDDTMGRTDHPEFAHTTERLEKLLQEKYDVIILATYNFGSLTGKLQYEILKRVVEGTGLVLANQDWRKLGELQDALLRNPVEDQPYPAAIPWSAFQSVKSEVINPYPGVRFRAAKYDIVPQFPERDAFLNTVRRYQVKKGRLALLDYGRQNTLRSGTALSPAIKYPLDRTIQHDYYISAAAKQIRWAAGRDAPVLITNVQPSNTSLDRTVLAKAGRVRLSSRDAKPTEYQLRCIVRDIDGDIEWRWERDLEINDVQTDVTVPLPALKTGEHFLDAWLLQKGKAVDWGSGHFTVTSAVAVDEIHLEHDVVKPGDPVSSTVKFTGNIPRATCRLRVIDSYGRLEVEKLLPLAAGQTECQFSLPLPDPVGIVFRVEAWLEKDGEVISEGRAQFTIPKHLTDNRFYGILWGGLHGPGPFGLLVFREARRYGYDASLSAHTEEYLTRAAAIADLTAVPYMIRLMSCDGAEHCITSPTWRKQMADGLSAHAAMVSKYGALGYSLGDEVRLERTICESPTCLRAFRDYLQRLYGTVEALNRKWRSSFKGWDEIRPSYVDDARKQNNSVPWMDYQMHRRDVWVEACRWCADSIHRGDPGSRMGYEGAGGYERWPELLEFFRIAGPYERYENDMVVDGRRPGTITGNWIGSYGANVEDSWARYVSWRRLLWGHNSQWWWTQQYAFNGDGTLVRRFATNVQAFAELNSGLGKLLFSGTFVHDPVAIPYCPASELASDIYSELTAIQGAKDAARALIHDLSLHYWRIPMKDFIEGELEKRGIRLVFLPYHQAMSREEADALRRFVEQGGTLIADLRPAVMDEHGDPPAQGFLDDVFGIRRTAPAASEPVRDVPRGTGPVEAIQESGIKLTADAAVAPHDGKALGTVGKAPIYVERKLGKGRAVLLNFSLDDYLTARETESHRPLQALFSALTAEAQVAPTVSVTSGGKPLDGLWLARWQVGRILVAGIDRWPVSPARDMPLKTQVVWPEAGHVYDVRAARYLGQQKETDITLAVQEPHLLAWLPYRIGTLSLRAPADARPGQRLEVAVELEGATEPHVVCLDVFGPDGKRRVYFRRRLLLKEGRGHAEFPLALNAPGGRWRIRGREVLSGQVISHEVDVASGSRVEDKKEK